MDPTTLLARFGPYAGAAVYCFLGGLIPIFNIEALLVILATTTEVGRHWLLLSIVAASAHMAAKSLVYAGGRGFVSGLGKGPRARIEDVQRRLERWRYGPSAFVFVSALIGLPPFYAVSVLAGTLRLSFARFFLAGLAGAFLRCAAFLVFPSAAIRFFRAH